MKMEKDNNNQNFEEKWGRRAALLFSEPYHKATVIKTVYGSGARRDNSQTHTEDIALRQTAED